MAIPIPTGRPLEYQICIDSRNRDLAVYPEPNDFTIPINFSRGLPVQRISLGSIELPLPQYIIEEAWNRIYFSEGLELIVNDPSNEGIRRFTIQEYDNDNIIVAEFPAYLNPIIDVNPAIASAGDTVVFTTMYTHSLELFSSEYARIGLPMSITATPLTGNITNLINDFHVLNETEFEIVVPDGVTFQSSMPSSSDIPIYGFVHAPAIPSPDILAAMLTNALNNGPYYHVNQYEVTFNPSTNQFCISIVSTNSITAAQYNQSNDLNIQKNCTLLSPASIVANGTNSLSFLMGFGCSNLPFPPFNPIYGAITTQGGCGSSYICGNYCFQCLSYISIYAANYNIEVFSLEFYVQINRFFFDAPCCTTSQGTPPRMVFSDSCGLCHLIELPYGRYLADTFAAEIEAQMNAAVGSTSEYSVIFDTAKQKFVFKSNSGNSFGLEFDDIRNTQTIFISGLGKTLPLTFAQRLGFYDTRYIGSNIYESATKIHVPSKGCNCSSMPIRALNNVYVPLFNPLHRVLGVNANFMRPVLVVVDSTDTDEGTVTFSSLIQLLDPSCGASLPDVDPVPFAHGFQPDDVVTIQITTSSGTTIYTAVVSEVIDATTFVVEIGSLSTSVFTDSDITSICVGLQGTPIFNLFFGSVCNSAIRKASTFPSNVIKHEVLGFAETAIQWDGPTSLPFFAQGQYNFSPPDYLLLILEPSESRYSIHTYKEDTITNVFSRIILYPAYRDIKNLPNEQVYQGLKVITELHFRILNPDHTLYNFHGQNWSATLIFSCAAATVNLTCP
jgi:hypothetical protein